MRSFLLAFLFAVFLFATLGSQARPLLENCDKFHCAAENCDKFNAGTYHNQLDSCEQLNGKPKPSPPPPPKPAPPISPMLITSGANQIAFSKFSTIMARKEIWKSPTLHPKLERPIYTVTGGGLADYARLKPNLHRSSA